MFFIKIKLTEFISMYVIQEEQCFFGHFKSWFICFYSPNKKKGISINKT